MLLLSIQFPIADARRFLDQVERLGSPGWPLPAPNSEFVRFFGAIRDRTLGGLAGWLGEDRICSANRGLSFSKNPYFIEGHTKTRIVFRRFYFDGRAVGKFEIGLHTNLRSFPAQLKDLETHLLRLPVRIRNDPGTPIYSELAQAGKHIAHLYLMASTPTKKAVANKDLWQVRSGTPILFLELRQNESITIPKEAKSINIPNWPANLKLFHYGIPYRGGRVYMWILQFGNSLMEEGVARTLRLYLLRLNAEHECLRLILQSIANKDIQITRGSAVSDDLQEYLDKAFKRITRYETKTGNVNEEIAEMARQSINIIRPGQLDILLENVADYRRYIRENMEKYAKQDASIVNYGYLEVNKMENKQGNTYNIENFQAGIANIESKLTNVTQSVGNVTNMDQPARDELKQLIEQLNMTLQKAPAEKIEDAEAVAETAKDLVEDISKDKPNKAKVQITLAGLKQAAENIAKVLPDVLPIAMQISSVISKSFGLG
jgi:hypothetical protein